MRKCRVCDEVLAKRGGEKPSRFAKRQTCSRACHDELLRRMRPDTRPRGSAATDHSKRRRAQRLYPLEGRICSEGGCDRPAVDRHHRNGDPGDNRPENVEALCRRHHRARHSPAPAPCLDCGREAPRGKRRKGRCLTCAAYWERTGRPRPWKEDGRREGAARGVPHPAARRPARACLVCGEEAKPARRGRCRRCYDHLRYHGVDREGANKV